MLRTLDFNTFTAGTVIDNEYEGVTISATGGSGQAMIFDSANPTGGDEDLASDTLGGLLIISEDGDSSDPDDNASGGTISFDFDNLVTMKSITFKDIEESTPPGTQIFFYDEAGNVIDSQFVEPTGDNGEATIELNVPGTARFEVVMQGSGAIDDVAFDDPAFGPMAGDGIVSNDDDGDLIDVTYTGDPDGDMIDNGDALLPGEAAEDDIVDAQGGNDTILSGEGDDEVYAGAGDDDVEGGAGDDVIYGDSELGAVADPVRESFNWEGLSDAEIDGGVSQDTGSVTVTYDRFTDTGAHDSSLGSVDLNVSGIDSDGQPIDSDSGLASITNGQGNTGAFSWEFSDAVSDVSFNINDIDGDGVVTVRAFDADGNPIEVNLAGGANLTLLDNDAVAGNDTADSNGGYAASTADGYNLNVTIPGPVARIEIIHTQDGTGNSGINVTDIFFDAPVVGGAAGNDDLNGEDGDDLIFGEGGDDTLTGGAGVDTLSGGDDADTFIGGNAGDVVDGGARGDDNDTLDLSDAGPLRVLTQTDDADGNSTSGTIGFLDADGNVVGDVLTFSEIENLILPEANEAPITVPDAIVTDEDTASDPINVLSNDVDPDGDTLTLTSATSPDGTVSFTPEGEVVFTPNDDFTGTTTITYTATDPSGASTPGTVDVTVNPVNDAPVAVDDVASTDEETSVIIDLIGNDTDVDNTNGELSLVTATVPADQGTLVDNGDGTVTFTPAADFTGDATITYTVSDPDGLTDEGQAVVSVGNVNDAPVTVDDTIVTDEDTDSDPINVLTNDSDPDGDTLTLTSATSPDGTVTFTPEGEVVFTPNDDFTGTTTITYTATDPSGASTPGTVNVTVNPINDAPVAVDDAETTEEDTSVIVDLIGNDTDVDNDTADLTLVTATVPADQGTLVDNGDGTVTFTPAEDFNGVATITYTVADPDGLTDEGQATVAVTGVNDDPVTVSDTIVMDEDTTSDPINVLDNDSDPDGDTLTLTSAGSPDGTVEFTPEGEVIFTPADDFTGTTTITYTVNDPSGGFATGTVNVTVNPVNDAPVAVDDVEATAFETDVVVDLIGNDTDIDNDVSELTLVTATVPADQGTLVDNGDGTVTFTPAAGFTGDATITYTVSDPDGLTDEGQAVVTVLSDPADGIVDGTDGDDLIDADYEGDPQGDLIDANDEILPGAGPNDDFVRAGDGDDTVLAGDGNDSVLAGDGDDSVDGGVGDDTLISGDGNDTVLGGDGDDLIDTASGELAPDLGYPFAATDPLGYDPDTDPENDRDSVDGGDGNDTIITGDDRDTITGGAGADVINSGIDDDIVDGGADDDRIVGGEGNDSILGGTGNDTIYAGNDPDLGLDILNIPDEATPGFPFSPDRNPDNGQDTVDGGDGDDVIYGADDDDLLIGGAGDDFLDGEIDDDTLQGGSGEDTLIGGQGDDSLEGGTGNDTLQGGIGDDTLRGNRDDDLLEGGDGNDVLDGGGENDTLLGGDGDDSLQGGQGDDVLDGGDGDDSITGGAGADIFMGGAGNDTMIGGGDQDTFSGVNAGDVIDGSSAGIDMDTLDLRGSAPVGGRLEVTYTSADQEDGFVTYYDEDNNALPDVLVFEEIETIVPCFTPGTRIATPKGERNVEELQVGDRVITRDNGIQVIRWVGQRDMSGAELDRAEHLKPVLIRQGALGNDLPERDMMVSPNHRVLVANDKTALYFEEREVLVAAKHLTGLDGVDIVDVSHTTYIHIMFDNHEVILSDGAWTESFQPGDMSLAGVGNAQRNEILELFPELATAEGIEGYASARRSLKKHEAKLLTK
ncbi:MAG: tandem-95 repeat protein [Sulfitobacter sp.]